MIDGATVIFKENKNLHRDGNKFKIHVHNRHYYRQQRITQKTVENVAFYILTWQKIFGHCISQNYQLYL